jgi:hypothetical protein
VANLLVQTVLLNQKEIESLTDKGLGYMDYSFTQN